MFNSKLSLIHDSILNFCVRIRYRESWSINGESNLVWQMVPFVVFAYYEHSSQARIHTGFRNKYILKKTSQVKIWKMVWTNYIFLIYWHWTRYIPPRPRSMELANIWSELLRNPGKGTWGVKIQKISEGSMPPNPSRSLCLWPVLIQEIKSIYPRSAPGSGQGIFTEIKN